MIVGGPVGSTFHLSCRKTTFVRLSHALWVNLRNPTREFWPEVKEPVRVVQSIEIKTVRRQIGNDVEENVSEWTWATSLPPEKLGAKGVVRIGHQRWSIENQGFNELVNHWNSDHIYRHESAAIVAFLLMTFLAFNVFHVFYHRNVHRNVKPARRKDQDKTHIARLILADLYLPRPSPPNTS